VKIHRYWTGDSPLPEYTQMFGIAASEFGEVVDWNDDNLPATTKSLVEKYRGYAPDEVKQKSNIVRLSLLYEFGGMWIDYDFLLLKYPRWGSEPWIASDGQRVCSCAMYFNGPKNPVLSQALDSITVQDTAWASSGEGMLNTVFADVNKRVLPLLKSGKRNYDADIWAVHFWSHRWHR
jgi:mannosyltransferase OCH1-like enzyme